MSSALFLHTRHLYDPCHVDPLERDVRAWIQRALEEKRKKPTTLIRPRIRGYASLSTSSPKECYASLYAAYQRWMDKTTSTSPLYKEFSLWKKQDVQRATHYAYDMKSPYGGLDYEMQRVGTISKQCIPPVPYPRLLEEWHLDQKEPSISRLSSPSSTPSTLPPLLASWVYILEAHLQKKKTSEHKKGEQEEGTSLFRHLLESPERLVSYVANGVSDLFPTTRSFLLPQVSWGSSSPSTGIDSLPSLPQHKELERSCFQEWMPAWTEIYRHRHLYEQESIAPDKSKESPLIPYSIEYIFSLHQPFLHKLRIETWPHEILSSKEVGFHFFRWECVDLLEMEGRHASQTEKPLGWIYPSSKDPTLSHFHMGLQAGILHESWPSMVTFHRKGVYIVCMDAPKGVTLFHYELWIWFYDVETLQFRFIRCFMDWTRQEGYLTFRRVDWCSTHSHMYIEKIQHKSLYVFTQLVVGDSLVQLRQRGRQEKATEEDQEYARTFLQK